jgi:TonB-dependent starch-binding outer membrane protein SusC
MAAKKLLFLVLCCWNIAVMAQQKTVSGSVRNAAGDALVGATVTEKGQSANSVQTDNDGAFRITLKGTGETLIVTYVGYAETTIDLRGRTSVAVTMQSDAKGLSDVVVVGYQTVKRRMLTGAVSTIRAEEIENIPSASVDAMMQGRVSGVNIQNFSGEPGTQGIVLIRGNTRIARDLDSENPVMSSPLYIIDGIPYNNDDVAQFQQTGTNFLAGINPNDIESIDVLKDASAAAIYGARGANGVILITTKRPKTGKPTITLNAYHGVTEKPKLREVMAGVEERRMKMAVIGNQSSHAQMQTALPMILTDSLNPAFNNATDWQKLFYQTGIIRSYDLSATGGSQTANYRVSLGLYDEEGIIKNYGFKRYSFSSTINLRPSDKLNIQTIIRYSYVDRKAGSDSRSAIPLNPGGMPSSLLFMSDIDREARLSGSKYLKDKRISHNLNLNTQVSYQLLNSLKFETRAGFSVYPTTRDVFTAGVLNNNGLASASSRTSTSYNANLTSTLTFNKAFLEDHNLLLTVGNGIEYEQNKITEVGGSNIVSDQIQVVQGVSRDYLYGGSDLSTRGLLSYFSQMQYDYKSRYILNVFFRADASSRFGKDNRWAYFPSVALGWIASDEKFFSNTDVISFLKFKASYGINGVEPPAEYGYYLAYNKYIAGAGNFSGQADNSLTYNGTVAVQPDWQGGVAQDKLSWVKTNQFNVGAEMAFGAQRRIRLDVDAYVRNVENGFFEFTLPYHTGYERIQTNGVGMRNAGVEVTLITRNLARNSPLQWNSRITLSKNRDIITSLPNGDRDLFTGGFYSNNKLVVGRSPNLFNLIRYDGVYLTESDIPVDPLTGSRISYIFRGSVPDIGWARFYDVNGDYFIRDDKNSPYGDFFTQLDPNPAITGGFLNDFFYKNWSLSLNCVFTFDRDIQNNSLVDEFWYNDDFGGITFSGIGAFSQMSISNYERMGVWIKPGDNAVYPRVPIRTDIYTWNPNSSLYMDKGSYVKLKTVQLGYSANEKFLSRFKARGLRLFLTLDNVLRWQNSKTVPDAEQVDFYGYYNGQSYPIPRKATLGLNLTL